MGSGGRRLGCIDERSFVMNFINWSNEETKSKDKNDKGQATNYELAVSLGVPEYVNLSTSEILKSLILKWHALNELYRKIVEFDSDLIMRNQDAIHELYQDLWIYSIAELLSESSLSMNQKSKLLPIFIKGVMEKSLDLSVHTTQKKSENSKKNTRDKSGIESVTLRAHVYFETRNNDTGYEGYMNQCFQLKSGTRPFFWVLFGYLTRLSNQQKLGSSFAIEYIQFLRCTTYYFRVLLSNDTLGHSYIRNKDQLHTIIRMSMNVSVSSDQLESQLHNYIEQKNNKKLELEAQIRWRTYISELSVYRIFHNPTSLYQYESNQSNIQGRSNCNAESDQTDLDSISHHTKDTHMIAIASLYTDIRDGKIQVKPIPCLTADEVMEHISQGNIPVLKADDQCPELESGELLHYADYVVRYCQKQDAMRSIYPIYGRLYITNQRVCFVSSGACLRIPYEMIHKMVSYDNVPQLLEIISRDRDEDQLLMYSSNAEIMYHTLRHLQGTTEEKKQYIIFEDETLSYFAAPTLESYIFNIQEFGSTELPIQMLEEIEELTAALTGLQDALEKYPSHMQSKERFLTYFIPDLLQQMYSFQNYHNTDLSDRTIKKVYDKVLRSIQYVTSAARQSIEEIYQLSTMKTVGQADALQGILGQEGYQPKTD